MHTSNQFSLNSDQLAATSQPTLAPWLQEFANKQTQIEAWFEQAFSLYTPPIYASVDLRFAGYKLTPVDTNLFPAGFNNISLNDYPQAVKAIKTAITKLQAPERWLLIPENHTRNMAYWKNVSVIQQLFAMAGCDIHIGSLIPELKDKKNILLDGKISFDLYPVLLSPQGIMVDNYFPDAILLNNDLADGIPAILKNSPQPFYPPIAAGWHQRKKSEHDYFYQQVVLEFSQMLGLDPWLIKSDASVIEPIDINTSESQQTLADQAQLLFDKIKTYYQQYNIQQDPFVMLKSNAGTYGQGVLSITAPDALLQLSRNDKQAMHFSKGKKTVTSFLLQEGVHTCEYFTEANIPAEPVIYLIHGQAIGGFYRINHQQSAIGNLNKPGMEFVTFTLSELMQTTDPMIYSRIYAYTVVARLAVLAAARELQELNA